MTDSKFLNQSIHTGAAFLARDPERFERLYQKRLEAYARADFRIEIVSDDAAAAVEAVLKLPIF